MRYYTEIQASCSKCEKKLVPFVTTLGAMVVKPCCECAFARVEIKAGLYLAIERCPDCASGPAKDEPADPAVQNVERALDATRGSLDGKTVDTVS